MASKFPCNHYIRGIKVLFVAFSLILVVFSFLDELLDLPHLLLGAKKTPANYLEVTLESGTIFVIFLFIFFVLNSILKRQQYLQGNP